MCWDERQSWVPRLSDVARGWQQLCEAGQTEGWGPGTRAAQRREEEDAASLVAMVTKE